MMKKINIAMKARQRSLLSDKKDSMSENFPRQMSTPGGAKCNAHPEASGLGVLFVYLHDVRSGQRIQQAFMTHLFMLERTENKRAWPLHKNVLISRFRALPCAGPRPRMIGPGFAITSESFDHL